jgi:plasmid stabilization system protein ParE
MPESFGPVSKAHRRAFIPRFPQIAYFRIEVDRIIILAVLHSARHSRKWKQRLEGDV